MGISTDPTLSVYISLENTEWEVITVKLNRLNISIFIASSLLTACSGLAAAPPVVTGPSGGTSAQAGDPATGSRTVPMTVPGPLPSTQPPATMPPETMPPDTLPPRTLPVKEKSEDELLVEAWGDRIFPGVTVSGIHVGGLTAEEAEAKVAANVQRILDRRIPFTVYGKKYSPTQKKLGLSIRYQKALDRAAAAYEEATLEEKAQALRTEPELNFKVTLSVDEDKLKAFIQEVADATYRKATPEREGRSLLKKTLQARLEEAIRFSSKKRSSFRAPVKTTPKVVIAAEDPNTIARGTSKFAESEIERSKNIRVATGRLNGVVIQPGETLSVLRVIKAPTLANGYFMSKVYAGDSLVDGVGGGVCQVSSTLYNAVIRAGLQIIDRSTHRFSVFYLPYGMDATIYAPSTDFKFKNTLDHPITIRGTAVKGKLTFSLISDETAMKGYSYKFYQTDITEGEKHWTIQYTEDLDPGEEEILVYPHPRASVRVYRKTYKDGKLIRTQFWDSVSYRELVGVKRVGK